MANWLVDMDPGTLFGEGARKQTGKKMKELGATRVMLVSDETMKNLGHTDEMAAVLKEAGLEVVEYQPETREPSSTMCNTARDFAAEHRIDGIVALGGGAVMDISKMVGKLLANGGNTEDYLGYEKANVPYKRFSPIICLPTTAGTGAEINHGISIFNDVTGKKGNTKHPGTLAITDPYYTYGLPKTLTANTGIDALAHAVETLCNSEHIPNWMSDALAREAVTLIFDNITAAYERDDHDARAKMCFAAELAGWAIKMRKTTFGHALGHRFANRYHWPHGVCCGICLPAVVRYNVTGNPYTTRILAKCIGVDCPENADMVQVGEKVVERFDALLHSIGLKSLKELGVEESFLDEISDDIRTDTKWTVVPNPPDFDLVCRALHDSYHNY